MIYDKKARSKDINQGLKIVKDILENSESFQISIRRPIVREPGENGLVDAKDGLDRRVVIMANGYKLRTKEQKDRNKFGKKEW